MSLKVRDGGNQIAFAFKNPDFYPAWERLKPIAIELSRKLGLDFVRYLEQLQKKRATYVQSASQVSRPLIVADLPFNQKTYDSSELT
jgi:hypothetical protein